MFPTGAAISIAPFGKTNGPRRSRPFTIKRELARSDQTHSGGYGVRAMASPIRRVFLTALRRSLVVYQADSGVDVRAQTTEEEQCLLS